MRVTGQDIIRRAKGEVTRPRRMVAASEIFKRARRDPDVEPLADADGSSNGTPTPTVTSRTGWEMDLARKLAWAVGSSLNIPYGRKSELYLYFEGTAKDLLAEWGIDGP